MVIVVYTVFTLVIRTSRCNENAKNVIRQFNFIQSVSRQAERELRTHPSAKKLSSLLTESCMIPAWKNIRLAINTRMLGSAKDSRRLFVRGTRIHCGDWISERQQVTMHLWPLMKTIQIFFQL